MTTKEAAAYLGVSVPTLHRRIKDGEIATLEVQNPALKRPRRVTLLRADVEALGRGERPASPPPAPAEHDR